MKRSLKKWGLRLLATCITCFVLLLIIVLNPLLTYANKTTHENYTIYHNKIYDKALTTQLDAATTLISTSEIFDPQLKLDICLNDGSKYPAIINKLKGPAFAFGFYNKVVLLGNANAADNFVELNGYKWNMQQLLAHEIVHCLQYHDLGFWKSNPVANIPNWKWEGYPEYVARQSADQLNIIANIDRLLAAEKTGHNGWVSFADGTGTVIAYYKSWLMIQYCMTIKKMSWKQLIADQATEQNVYSEMMRWHQLQKN